MSGTDEVEQTAVNDSGTGAGSDTPLTHGRSGFDLEDTRRELTALRVKHGADTPIGHRCSNINELLKRNPPPAELIQRQMAELQALLAAR